jgi:hypothetical protein
MKRILIAAVAALSLAACSQQPTVQEVADAAGNGSVALMKEANSSTGAFAGSSVSVTLGQLRTLADRAQVMPSLRFLPSPVTQAVAKTTMMNVTAEADGGTPVGVDAQADALGKFLRERIFTEANLESSGNGALTFRITGDDVCGDGITPAPDCVSAFDLYEVRIRVTRGMLGYQFYLELGPDRFEPLMVLLSENHIGVGVDLAAVKSSLIYLDTVSGQPVYAPKTLEGVFMVDLKKNGDQDFTLSSAVTKAIHVETDGEAGPVSFSTGVKDPWFTVRVQGKQHSLSADLDLGVTEFKAPYATLSDSGTAGRELEGHLAGASASVKIAAGATSLSVTNIGLGDGQSTLALDGTDLLKVDLNPDSGRRFDVSLGLGANNQLEIKVTPEFDLTTVFFYQPLQADTDVSIPAYAVDSTYRFELTGNNPTLAPASNGIKVTSGTLRLENSAHADQAVVVNAGKCLVTVVPAGEDPLIGQYAAQDCL